MRNRWGAPLGMSSSASDDENVDESLSTSMYTIE